MVFQSGESGNPLGRPVGALGARRSSNTFASIVREAQEAFKKEFPTIVSLMLRAAIGEIELEKSQAWAIDKALNRFLGKEFQSTEPLALTGLGAYGEDEDAIPNMSFQEIRLLKNRMVAELIYTLYNNGKLKEIVNMIEGGWKPYEDEIVVEQLAIEGKK